MEQDCALISRNLGTFALLCVALLLSRQPSSYANVCFGLTDRPATTAHLEPLILAVERRCNDVPVGGGMSAKVLSLSVTCGRA